MYQLRETDTFGSWLSKLRDVRAKARILARLDSARLGNLGDVRSVGGGVSEMRVDVGVGYRVYFTRRQRVVPGKGYRSRPADGESDRMR